MDQKGNDFYSGTRFAQGCGLLGGFGVLVDGSGNDNYYSKGKYPPAYNEPGLFESFSQGSAIGFRGLASGGIGMLADLSGNDRYEAGHFSQGGGYYFAWGLLYDHFHKALALKMVFVFLSMELEMILINLPQVRDALVATNIMEARVFHSLSIIEEEKINTVVRAFIMI